MGTKVHCESYLPVYHSMRDLNEDSSSSSWPLCYGDKPVANGQYYNGYAPRTTADSSSGNNKDVLKQRMLEHEAVFKDQVYELHRLYRRQQDMMQEVRRNEVTGLRESMEPSSSSSHRGPMPQVQSEDARKWHMAGFPLSNSPMSCTKGNSQQPYQNGSISKETEALGTRPLKVRKKLFDLQLPADECIDLEEGETLPEVKVPDVLSYASNANLRIDPESRRKSNMDNHAGLEPDCRIVASSSASRLRNPTGLADLNEPVVVEEVISPLPPGFRSHCSINGETKGIHQPEKVHAGYIGMSGEPTHARNGYMVDSVESKVNESRRLSGIYQAGSSRSNLHSLNHCLQQGKLPMSSHPVQGMLNPTNHPPGNYPSGRREDPWRVGNLQLTDKNRDSATNGHLAPPHVAPQTNGSYPFFASWPQPASSWTKPNNSSTKKISALESSSSPSQVPFGGNWRVSGNTVLYRHLGGGEPTAVNGFHQASASGSKDLKAHLSSGFDGHKLKNNNSASDHVVTNGVGSFPKGSSHVDSKPVLDFNLNEAFSMGSENEVDPGSRNGKGKLDGNLSTIPWLKRKPADTDSSANARKSEILGESRYCPASSEQFCSRTEIIRDLNQPFVPSDGEGLIKKEIVETQNVTKILGVPVFETGKQSPNVSTSAGVYCPGETSNGIKERKRRLIDINLECMPDEEEPSAEEEKRLKGVCTREYIDLNSCASDCEDPSAPSDQSQAACVKKILDIDLEAPAAPDEDEDNTPLEQDTACEVVSLQSITEEEPNDEVVRNAANMMVSISSCCPQQPEDSLAESLVWFADVLTNDMEGTLNNELIVTDGIQAEIDEFEAMTLRLRETKEGDYMPDPFIPETQNCEEPGANASTTRPRRGQSRRGRPRRDFQRDILPGVATLSRHEVTEDIQLFTGMMRATGHDWTSTLTRRNGAKTRGARGRRRAVAENVPSPAPCTPLVQTMSNGEAVGLEDRSLTGWGKTTRRPRRQRCHAAGNGNPQAIVLT